MEVVVIKAIPKKILIHSVTLICEVEKDSWGKATKTIGIDLAKVRMEPSKKIIKDKDNNEIQLAAVLFYDCKNSRPAGVTFVVDNIIIFNGEAHRICAVEPLYDEKKLHHYEIGLVRNA